jgi:hypothetical protein
VNRGSGLPRPMSWTMKRGSADPTLGDAPTARRGYWLYLRGYFDALRRTHGAVAVQIMTDLITNAGVAQHNWTAGDGGIVTLDRGWALFSVRECAARLDRSPSMVHRVFRRLVQDGHVSVVKMGRRLKRRKGTSPTIVSVSRYDDFSNATARARIVFETSTGTEGRMLKVKHHLGDDSLSSPLTEANDVLAYYEDVVAPARNPADALNTISAALAGGHSPSSLKASAKVYVEMLTARSERHRMPPEHFYLCHERDVFQCSTAIRDAVSSDSRIIEHRGAILQSGRAG